MKKLYGLESKRVWIAGHFGMVGSALVRRLAVERCEILTVDRQQVDLTRQTETENWMAAQMPDTVFIAAARVGGIYANDTFPADFLYDNLAIEANIIRSAWKIGVKKLLFLGSSCAYPREAPQPIPEAALLTGSLEPTNEGYAIAKIAGIRLCQAHRRQYGCDFISVMPTNVYGPGDNFHSENSHVPAALLRRIYEAKESGAAEVLVWGSGRPRREFLFVDDLADACVFLMQHYSGLGHVNVGTGVDITIADFAQTIKRIVGYQGHFFYDTTRPDGMHRKVMDVSMLTNLGWSAKTSLEDGLNLYYKWFLANVATIRQ